MHRTPCKLSVADFFYYRIWDDTLVAPEEKLTFIDRKKEQMLHQITGDVGWFGVFHDKLLNILILERAGFPVPETIGLFRRGRSINPVECFSDRDQLRRFLQDAGQMPWFGKPATGIRSVGTVRVNDYDSTSDELLLAGGRRVMVDSFIDSIDRYSTDGFLFQKILQPHKKIANLTAGRLAGARLIFLLRSGLPSLDRALLKIPVGDNIADNFWRSGNIIAAIDNATGKITRAVSGVGNQMHEVETHPDSGVALRNFEIPGWTDALKICMNACALFPQIRMQAWDVAICESGPVLMEANVGGDFNLPQIAHAKGMMTPEFRRFLKECAEERGKHTMRLLKRLGLNKE